MLLFNASVLHRELCELKYEFKVIFSSKIGRKVLAAQTSGGYRFTQFFPVVLVST